VFIIYSNFVGNNNTIPPTYNHGNANNVEVSKFCGQSAIIGMDGMDIVRANKVETGLFLCEINSEQYKGHIARNDYLKEKRY
jgi:predicted amidohydrolase